VISNHLDQVAKFNEIQVVDYQLASPHDVALIDKSTLKEFYLATQVGFL
jgi:hypothetical protein